MGRPMVGLGIGAWGEEPTFHAPCFVITHRPADTIIKKGGTSYIFVTHGIEAALEQAQHAAGSRDILVNGGADIGKQFLNAGLLDQLRLHLVPVIMGEGTRLLDGVVASVRLIPREASGAGTLQPGDLSREVACGTVADIAFDLGHISQPVNRVDPSAFVAPTAVLLGAVTVKTDASIWYGAVLRADLAEIVIDESSNVQDLSVIHVDKGFPCIIGPRVSVGHRTILHGCSVEADCLIGMGSIVLTGVRVGEGSVIGAGALLPEGMHVPPRSVVFGVPGRVYRESDAELALRSKRAWEQYVDLAKRYRAGEFS